MEGCRSGVWQRGRWQQRRRRGRESGQLRSGALASYGGWRWGVEAGAMVAAGDGAVHRFSSSNFASWSNRKKLP